MSEFEKPAKVRYHLVLRADEHLAAKYNVPVGEVLTTCGHRHWSKLTATLCGVGDQEFLINAQTEVCPE
jgi:hypothetical protein